MNCSTSLSLRITMVLERGWFFFTSRTKLENVPSSVNSSVRESGIDYRRFLTTIFFRRAGICSVAILPSLSRSPFCFPEQWNFAEACQNVFCLWSSNDGKSFCLLLHRIELVISVWRLFPFVCLWWKLVIPSRYLFKVTVHKMYLERWTAVVSCMPFIFLRLTTILGKY